MRIAILACLLLAACNIGAAADGDAVAVSGTGTTRTFAARDFSSVDLRGGDTVNITAGPDYAIRAEGDSDMLDRLDIRRDGTTLRIGRQSGISVRSTPVRIHVTMPAIHQATVAGSGDLLIDRVRGDFVGTVAGSGDMKIAVLNGGTTTFDVGGSGSIVAAGTVDRLSLSVAGSGDIDASRLRATGADVSIAGSGDVMANVTGPATVSMVGSGSATLGRGARCTVSKAGSGKVRCG